MQKKACVSYVFRARHHFVKIQLIQQDKLGNHYYDLYLPICETEVFLIHKLVAIIGTRKTPQIQHKLPTLIHMSSAKDDKPCEHGQGTFEPFFVYL